MSDPITVDISELTAWAAKIAGGPTVVAEESRYSLDRSVKAVQREGQLAAPFWHGHLRRSIVGVVVSPTLGTVGSNLPYAEVMDKGRTPGKPMPPAGALLPWMADHGIPATAEFPVRRAIGRRGIAATRFLTGTFERMRPQIMAELETIKARIVARLRP